MIIHRAEFPEFFALLFKSVPLPCCKSGGFIRLKVLDADHPIVTHCSLVLSTP